MRLKLTLISAAALTVIGMIALGITAQIQVAIDIANPQMRLNGATYAFFIAVWLIVALLPIQVIRGHSRRNRMLMYVQVAAIAISIGTGYQIWGIAGMELHLINAATATTLVFLGICISVGSMLYGMFGHKIPCLQLTR